MPSLDALQQWMQAVITHPQGVAAGLRSPRAQAILPNGGSVEAVVTRSKALDSIGRLEVYANAYYARLMACLREEFPVLVLAIGGEAFDDLAFGYLQTYPSTSYTLNHLGDRFPQYLAESRPPRSSGSEGPDWADLLADLAHLELEFSQVFDGPGIEKTPLLTAESLLAIAPEVWAGARLIPAPCLRVVELRFPLDSLYTALRKGEPPEFPQPQQSWMAITRRDYVVRRHVLSRPQAVLLQAILRGQTIGEAIESAARETEDLDRLAGNLRDWFREWSRAAFFIRVQT